MQIVFLASSMASRGEHSYRLLEEVGSVLRARRMAYRIFAARSVEPELAENIGAIPHFTHSLYNYDCVYNNLGPILTEPSFRWIDQLWGGAPTIEFLAVQLHRLRQRPCPDAQSKYIPLEYRDWKALNKSYLADLNALPADVWAPDNLIVVTATCQNQFGGLVHFLREQNNRRRLPRVICHLMFPPHWSPSGRTARLGRKFYEAAFADAAPLIGKTLFFTAENEAMIDIFRTEFGINARILPVPLQTEGPPPGRTERTARLGFFGYSKRDKGFHLLPRIAALCRDKGLDVEFHVQIQHSHWEQATIEAEHALRALPNVRIIEGALSSQDYMREASRMDVMILPYDPVLFGMRGSGIFTESLAAGRPIVASAGTFAAESIKTGEAQGEIFAPYTAEAAATAIERLLPRLAQCKEQASTKAAAFARKHNGDAYVDVLLSFAATGARERRKNETIVRFPTREPQRALADSLAAQRTRQIL